MLRQPMEMKTNYPWKEVHKLFTALCNRAPGTSAERREEAWLPRCWWEQSWTHWAQPQQSLLGFSDRKSHVVSFSAAERDRCIQINITVQYQRLIVISLGILTKENNTTLIPLELTGASRVFPLLLVTGGNKVFAGDWDSYFWKPPSAKRYYSHFGLIILLVGVVESVSELMMVITLLTFDDFKGDRNDFCLWKKLVTIPSVAFVFHFKMFMNFFLKMDN